MSVRYVESLFRTVSSPATRLDLQSVLTSLAAATAATSAAPLDHLYARIGALNGPFFPCGWGNLSVVNYEEDLRHLIQKPPASIKLSWRLVERGNRDGIDYLLYEGTFRTPCLQRVFDALPPESRTGRVQLLMPARLQPFLPSHGAQPDPGTAQSAGGAPGAAAAPSRLPYPYGHSLRLQPDEQQQPQAAAAGFVAADGPACVVHLAATGDQTFGRRLSLGFPLLKDNVCSMVLESPFYGARRPAAQRGSKLQRVSDLLTLGWATIAESINLLHWLREEGYGALGMCGLSMGGVHACMTAGLYPGEVAVTPLLAPRSAAVAYCDGAMRAVMAWEPLLKEVDENNNHIAQVLQAAGRPITIQLPLLPAPYPGARGPPANAEADPAAAATPTPTTPVALMREATYALADLELRGERQHLAAAGSAAGPPGGGGGGSVLGMPVRSATGGQGGGAEPGAGLESAAAGGGTAGVDLGTVGGGGGRGPPGGSVLRGLPFVSIMDVYSKLVAVAVRLGSIRSGGGGGGGNGGSGGYDASHLVGSGEGEGQGQGAAAVAAQRQQDQRLPLAAGAGARLQHADPQQSLRPGGAAAVTAAGAPAPGAGATHASTGPEQQRPWQHTDPRAARSHPQPHAADKSFHPLPGPATVTAGPASTSAALGGSVGTSSGAGGSGERGGPTGGSSGGGGSGGGGGTPLGRRLLGDLGRTVRELRAGDRRLDDPVTVKRLKSVLETYTDITRYPRPRRTDAAVIVAARDDAYVSPESVRQLHSHWPGSELRMVSGGHVSAFLLHQEAFRGALRDSLARLARPPPPSPHSRQHPQPHHRP